jgi:hypothetical protein
MIREIAFSFVALVASGCYADPVAVDASYPSATYDGTDVDVPAPYVATTEPVYYGGHAAYWYNNGWRYREGGRWNSYRTEPAGLRQYRGNRGGYRQATTQRRYEGAHSGGTSHGHR